VHEIEALSLFRTLLSLEEIAGVSSRRGAVVAAHERGLLHLGPAAGHQP
jgi:hypothetical protein